MWMQIPDVTYTDTRHDILKDPDEMYISVSNTVEIGYISNNGKPEAYFSAQKVLRGNQFLEHILRNFFHYHCPSIIWVSMRFSAFTINDYSYFYHGVYQNINLYIYLSIQLTFILL